MDKKIYFNNEKEFEEIVIRRLFKASRDVLWKAWTDPELLMKWCGPKDFTSPFCKIDFRVGGRYLICMRSSEGEDMWSTGTFREIINQHMIAYTDCFADDHGNVVSAAYYGLNANFPAETLVTVAFNKLRSKTRIKLMQDGLPPGKMTIMIRRSWSQSFDKLAESLK